MARSGGLLGGRTTTVLSGLLILLLGAVGLWAGHDAGRQAEAAHRADRLALQLTLANLTGLSSQVAALEITDILAAQERAGLPAWAAKGGTARNLARLRSSAQGSRAMTAGAVLVSPTAGSLASWMPAGSALPLATDPGWAALRAKAVSGRHVLPVSDVLDAGGEPAVAVAVPTRLSDGSTGLLIGLAYARTSALGRYVQGLRSPDGRRGYVVDGRGLVIAGPDPALVGRPLPGGPLRAAVVGRPAGVSDVRDDGRTWVVSHAPAGETGWSQVTVQDRTAFLGPLQRSARRAQASLVVLLLGAGIALLALHRRREAALRTVAVTDHLTGARNRGGWYAQAARELERAARDGRTRALLFVDLDDLKQINDAMGHREGDRAIAAAADLLRDCARPGDLLGRIGGDEFVLLLVDDAAAPVLAAVRAAGARRGLRLSIGSALWEPDQPADLDELVRRGDAAMYADKLLRRVG